MTVTEATIAAIITIRQKAKRVLNKWGACDIFVSWCFDLKNCSFAKRQRCQSSVYTAPHQRTSVYPSLAMQTRFFPLDRSGSFSGPTAFLACQTSAILKEISAEARKGRLCRIGSLVLLRRRRCGGFQPPNTAVAGPKFVPTSFEREVFCESHIAR